MSRLLSSFNKKIYESIRMGVVPREWIDASLTPILKKGICSEPGNYIEMSLTYILYHARFLKK